MPSLAPKPVDPVEMEIRVRLGIDGQWYANGIAHDMRAESPPMESPERAAEFVARTLYGIAVALRRTEWFWP